MFQLYFINLSFARVFRKKVHSFSCSFMSRSTVFPSWAGRLPLPILAYHFAPSSRNLGSAPVLNTVRMCADFLKTCRPTVFVSGGDSFFNLI